MSTQAGSRKCWPKRFARAWTVRPRVVVGSRFAPPVPLFDFLDLFLTEAEVVPDLVDQRLANHGANLVVVFAVFLDRPLKKRDAIGQDVAERPCAFGERGALIEAVQRIGRLDIHFLEQLRTRFGLDDEREVLHLATETFRDEAKRLHDEALELGACHVPL